MAEREQRTLYQLWQRMSPKRTQISAVEEAAYPKTDINAYVTHHDFCQIFCQHMKDLYLLALLLTADHQRAEQCFVVSLEDCLLGRPIFREWAERWSRRAIITNAIQIIAQAKMFEPTFCESDSPQQPTMGLGLGEPLNGIPHLAPFERFVLILSVFERYTVQECSLLLSITRGDVVRARTRALQKLAGIHSSTTANNPAHQAFHTVGTTTAHVDAAKGRGLR
jgi:hypothetical protein